MSPTACLHGVADFQDCSECWTELEADLAEFDAVTPEQHTLALAREGISPEDERQALARVMERLRELKVVT